MKTNTINYPVKYAIQTHYSYPSYMNLDKKEPVGFTVSKVYYIGKTTKTNEEGAIENIHHVVFPFRNILDISDNKRTYPNIDDNGVCQNETEVYEVFDSYEAAEAVRGEFYRAYYFQFMDIYPREVRENNLDTLMREFFDQTQVYELYELQALSLTEDMYVDEDIKGKEKIL